MQAHAEHQQHHPDLGELRGEVRVGDEAWREGPDQDPGHEVADQRRQVQPGRHEPEHQRESQARGDGGDEREVVFHE